MKMPPWSLGLSRYGKSLPAALVVASAALAPLLAACGDPVHDAQVQALGPENPSIPVGQYHRAGQPCVVCHGPEGPASAQFVLAGTVFSGKSTTIGVNLAYVDFLDDSRTRFCAPTNCVGNFFVSINDWSPGFPIDVGVIWPVANPTSNCLAADSDGVTSTPMPTHIGREGSCANCHYDPPGLNSTGHVYINYAANPNNPNCPVSPVAGSSQGNPLAGAM